LADFNVHIGIVNDNPLELEFTVSNAGAEQAEFLRWGTPFEGVSDDMFDVRDEQNNRLNYLGKIIMRDEPIAEDYVIIPAGGSLSTTLDLGQSYEFSSVGKYIVRLDFPTYCQLQYSSTDSQVATVFQLKSVPERRPTGFAPEGFTNCNANEISYTNTAISGGRSESASSFNCLNGGTCAARYTRWFGTRTTANFNFVTVCYRNINTALGGTFNGYCDKTTCAANTFAYVYPTDGTRTVYLCPLFFNRSGDRNRVIVHELSHFSSICGTQDYTYGESSCLNLARTNPNNACRNADNVCYFAGNY
jgi:peptidyl-Lys metalloendopeptidase